MRLVVISSLLRGNTKTGNRPCGKRGEKISLNKGKRRRLKGGERGVWWDPRGR